MTYYVSSGTLNPAHSLTHYYWYYHPVGVTASSVGVAPVFRMHGLVCDVSVSDHVMCMLCDHVHVVYVSCACPVHAMFHVHVTCMLYACCVHCAEDTRDARYEEQAQQREIFMLFKCGTFEEILARSEANVSKLLLSVQLLLIAWLTSQI